MGKIASGLSKKIALGKLKELLGEGEIEIWLEDDIDITKRMVRIIIVKEYSKRELLDKLVK